MIPLLEQNWKKLRKGGRPSRGRSSLQRNWDGRSSSIKLSSSRRDDETLFSVIQSVICKFKSRIAEATRYMVCSVGIPSSPSLSPRNLFGSQNGHPYTQNNNYLIITYNWWCLGRYEIVKPSIINVMFLSLDPWQHLHIMLFYLKQILINWNIFMNPCITSYMVFIVIQDTPDDFSYPDLQRWSPK